MHSITNSRLDEHMCTEPKRRPTREVFFKVIDEDMNLFSDYEVESVWCDLTDSLTRFLAEVCAKKTNFQYMDCSVFQKQEGCDYDNMRCLFHGKFQGVYGNYPMKNCASMDEVESSISNPLVLVIPRTLSLRALEEMKKLVEIRLGQIQWWFNFCYDIKSKRSGSLEDVFMAREGQEGVDWDYTVADFESIAYRGGRQIIFLKGRRRTECKLCDVFDDQTWDKLRRIHDTVRNHKDGDIIPRFTLIQVDDILQRWKA